MNNTSLAAIILAAGKGTRFKSMLVNKVVLPFGGKPMIVHAVDFVKKLHITPIFIVVGFAKESVIAALKEKKVVFVEQKQQLGTGDAVRTALSHVPAEVTHVLVIQGDDALFYRDENKKIVGKLIATHLLSKEAITFLTVELKNPQGMGRIVRDEVGNVVAIVEQHEATEQELGIIEVNTACYMFRVDFLKRYLPKLEKNNVTGEYQFTDLVRIARDAGETVEAVAGGSIPWRGVNTKDELLEAELLFKNTEKNTSG